MNNGTSGLSASDVLSIMKDNNNDGFLSGNAGGILALIIVFILLFGNGGWGGNNAVTAGLSDVQMAQFFQTQDNAIRGLAAGQANTVEQVMSSNYDNALLLKDLSNQMSNSVAAIGNQIATQTATMTSLFQQNTIDNLRDRLNVTRDELSNTRQTAQITDNILSNLATTAPKPPCYYNFSCGCGNTSLY